MVSPATTTVVTQDDFRAALRSIAQPTALLAGHDADGDVVACVVNTVFPVSAEHPSVGVSLQHGSSTHRRMADQATFWISFFVEGDDQWVRTVARADAAERGSVADVDGEDAAPMMPNDATAFECQVVRRVDAWDHEILLAEVVGVRVGVTTCLSM